MRKLLLLSTSILFFSCSQPQKKQAEEEKTKMEYIYDATYLDDFTIGNPELVLKVQEMHQYIISKDFESAVNYLAEDVEFWLEDGSTMKGKETILQFMIDVYSSIEIKNYKVAVNLAVTGKNGDEWVLLWDNGTILSEDGTSASFRWMESFRFENGKIVVMNQFSKPLK